MSMAVEEPAAVIRQHEMKFILNVAQEEYLRKRLRERLDPDRYGRTSVASLYYDTPDRRLIRASVEKPVFKEKIRVRSYGPATDSSPVFLEIKRKLSGVVCKRRVRITVPRASAFFRGEDDLDDCGQIGRELVCFRNRYEILRPSCLIVAERTGFFSSDGDLRLTLDEAPRYRTEELVLTGSLDGVLLLPEGSSILEIKTQQAIPMWLTNILSDGAIYKGSFSKYGAAYRQLLSESLPERVAYYV